MASDQNSYVNMGIDVNDVQMMSEMYSLEQLKSYYAEAANKEKLGSSTGTPSSTYLFALQKKSADEQRALNAQMLSQSPNTAPIAQQMTAMQRSEQQPINNSGITTLLSGGGVVKRFAKGGGPLISTLPKDFGVPKGRTIDNLLTGVDAANETEMIGKFVPPSTEKAIKERIEKQKKNKTTADDQIGALNKTGIMTKLDEIDALKRKQYLDSVNDSKNDNTSDMRYIRALSQGDGFGRTFAEGELEKADADKAERIRLQALELGISESELNTMTKGSEFDTTSMNIRIQEEKNDIAAIDKLSKDAQDLYSLDVDRIKENNKALFDQQKNVNDAAIAAATDKNMSLQSIQDTIAKLNETRSKVSQAVMGNDDTLTAALTTLDIAEASKPRDLLAIKKAKEDLANVKKDLAEFDAYVNKDTLNLIVYYKELSNWINAGRTGKKPLFPDV